jgi:hypothetical protein
MALLYDRPSAEGDTRAFAKGIGAGYGSGKVTTFFDTYLVKDGTPFYRVTWYVSADFKREGSFLNLKVGKKQLAVLYKGKDLGPRLSAELQELNSNGNYAGQILDPALGFPAGI